MTIEQFIEKHALSPMAFRFGWTDAIFLMADEPDRDAFRDQYDLREC